MTLPDFGQLTEFLGKWGEKLQGIIPSGTARPYDSGLKFMGVAAEVDQSSSDLARRELIAKLISTLIGATLSIGITYVGVKYLVNVMDPTHKEKIESQKRAQKLLTQIGVKNVKLTEYELCIASNLVDPLSMTISWKDIGGLRETIQEIRETVILPFQRNDLFKDSALIQSPKGVLLYGPPGCGKTLIAKATAKAAGARFINLQVSSLVDKWYGESQKRAEAVFSLAMKLQPVIIFIDEIDSFLRSRTSNDHEATAMIKTQFMSFWDGLMTDHQCRIMIMGATNRPGDVDAAILRRMPCMFNVGLPDAAQRKQILSVILKDEPVEAEVDLDAVSRRTPGLSGSDLKELCRTAAIYRLREYLSTEESDDSQDVFHNAQDRLQGPEIQLRKMNMEDFEHAMQKMKETKNITLLKDIAVD